MYGKLRKWGKKNGSREKYGYKGFINGDDEDVEKSQLWMCLHSIHVWWQKNRVRNEKLLITQKCLTTSTQVESVEKLSKRFF